MKLKKHGCTSGRVNTTTSWILKNSKKVLPYLINVLYIIITADLSSRIDGAMM